MSNIIYGIIYKLPLSDIIRAMFLLLVVWFFLGMFLKYRTQKINLWKAVNALVFLCILTTIIHITLSNRSSGTSEAIMIPFHSFVEARVQPEMYRSMLMNVFLFFPIGLSLPNILPDRWKNSALIAVVFAFLLSSSVEFLQYRYQLGRVEIDDVICNTFGCMVGTLSYLLEIRFAMKQSLQP